MGAVSAHTCCHTNFCPGVTSNQAGVGVLVIKRLKAEGLLLLLKHGFNLRLQVWIRLILG